MPVSTPPTSKRNTRAVANSQASVVLSDIEQLIFCAKDEILRHFQVEVKKINNSLEKLTTKIERFEGRLTELQEKSIAHENQIQDIRNTIGKMSDSITVNVTKEMEQRAQRMQNLIISGIPELNNGSIEDRRTYDEDEVSGVFQVLGMENPSSCRVSRIGKPRQDRPRLLKITCPDAHTKQAILRNGKVLRKSTLYKKVFVNEDQTPMQQQQSRLLREELRTRREQGEDAVIFRGKVVKRSDLKNFQSAF